MSKLLNLSSGPHIRDRWTTRFIMLMVCAALTPTAVIGVIVNGWHALWIILLSMGTAFLSEFAFDKICKKPDTWKDCSALVTGLLLALSLSPSTPLYAPVIGAMFAIFVAKCFFGGLGKNFINPALAGRCFLLISFGRAMTVYEIDGVASATPIAVLRDGGAVNISRMFIGTAGGVIGASVFALAIGGLVLWYLDIIHGQIWVSVLVGFTVFMGLFGGHGFNPEYLAAQLCGGGVVMGAFFMATDYTTSPVSRLGQTVYGVLIGVLGALFRVYGSAADSFSYSIIIANLCVPLIETYVIRKPYAYWKSAQRAAAGEEQLPFWKRIPRPVIVLTVVTLCAGLALGGIYTITKDRIAEQKRQESLASYLSVMPDAAEIVTDDTLDDIIGNLAGIPFGEDQTRTYLNEAVIGKNAAGEVVGYGISASNMDGYDGEVTLSVGLDKDGTITGIAYTKLTETPGMGMQCDEPAFKDQFIGKSVEKLKLLMDGGSTLPEEVDGVSGCTRTSSASVNAVNAALEFYNSVMKGGSYGE